MFPLPKLGKLLIVDDFLPYVGTTYMVEATPQPIAIRLEQIDRKQGESWMVREPFVLVFSSPWNALLLEGEYSMQPEGGPTVKVYLIPTQSYPGERRFYHSVFA